MGEDSKSDLERDHQKRYIIAIFWRCGGRLERVNIRNISDLEKKSTRYSRNSPATMCRGSGLLTIPVEDCATPLRDWWCRDLHGKTATAQAICVVAIPSCAEVKVLLTCICEALAGNTAWFLLCPVTLTIFPRSQPRSTLDSVVDCRRVVGRLEFRDKGKPISLKFEEHGHLEKTTKTGVTTPSYFLGIQVACGAGL